MLGEREGRIEVALSLFVAAVWIGAIGNVVSLGVAWGNSWLCAIAMGLWEIAQALVGDRRRRLVLVAFWLWAARAVYAAIWYVAKFWELGAVTREPSSASVSPTHLVGMGLNVATVALWVAVIVSIARMGHDGARRRWVGHAVLAVLAVFAALFPVGYLAGAFTRDRQVLEAASIALRLVGAAATLALLLPARRAFRKAVDFNATIDAFDQSAPPPSAQEAWRGVPEVRNAASQLVEIRRRLGCLAVLFAVAVASVFICDRAGVPVLGAVVEVAIAAIGLVPTALLARNVVRYTRLPYKFPGRILAIAALAFVLGAWLQSVTVLALLAADGTVVTKGVLGVLSRVVAGSALITWVAASVVMSGSLALSAGALRDLSVRRRVWVALAVCAGWVGVIAATAAVIVGRLDLATFDTVATFVTPELLVGGVAFAFALRWLLAGAARMLAEPV